MGVDPNWGLAGGNNALASFQTGMQLGNHMREQKEKRQERNALAAYATDPNDENLKGLAPYRPEIVMQERQRRDQEKKQGQERQLIGAALNGDANARSQLAYVNSDMYLKLDDRGKAEADKTMGAIAQQAFSILQLPPEQRGAALQDTLARMQAQGMDVSGFKSTGDPTQDLKIVLAQAGKLDEWEQFAQPKYTPVGEGGLAGFQFGQPIQQGGGQVRNFGPSAPQGVTFTPIDGGPTQPASGDFRP